MSNETKYTFSLYVSGIKLNEINPLDSAKLMESLCKMLGSKHLFWDGIKEGSADYAVKFDSQYLDENWTNGQILLMKGDTIESIKLRLNAYTGEMHYKNENTEYSIGAPENIKEIIMGGKVFIFSPYINEGMVTKNYFEVLVAGKNNLLVLHYITKMKATYNKALDTGDKNERLIAAERYFVKNGATIVEIDKKGKNLIEIIGDKGSKVKEQVEKEDLSYKNKEDLIKIITYLNSLN